MASILEGNLQSYTTSEALDAGDRVIFDAAALTVSKAAATDRAVGCVEQSWASGALAKVRMFVPGHTVKLRLAGTVALGATLYAAADGEVDDAATASDERYRGLQAGAANELVECLVLFSGVDTTV